MIADIIRAREHFAAMAGLDEEAFPLDRVALALAMEEYPDLDLRKYLDYLDVLASRVGVLAGTDADPAGIIEILNEVLFVQEGFRGNREDYYDPRNYYLNEVLDRKLGIPVTLSILYMEVAKRIGCTLDGVGFPEHFLVKHSGEDRDIIIDVFNHGRILTMKDCQELLDRTRKGGVPLSASLLQPMEKRAIITRILYNLKGIYRQKEHPARELSVINRILLLNPGIPSELRDRGLLYMQSGMFCQALCDLDYYLAHAAAGRDAGSIRKYIRTIRGIIFADN